MEKPSSLPEDMKTQNTKKKVTTIKTYTYEAIIYLVDGYIGQQSSVPPHINDTVVVSVPETELL